MGTIVKVTGHLYAEQLTYARRGRKAGDFECTVLPYVSSDPGVWGVYLGPIEFTHTLPEGLDLAAEMVRQKIASLQAEKDEAGRVYAAKVKDINNQLAKLQAITCEVAA